MREHGDFRVVIDDGNVVHVYPTGGFNELGINALHEKVAAVAPSEKPWVLLEHPSESAAITPEALNALCDNYGRLSEIGCVAVGLEVSGIWEYVIKNAVEYKVTIPVYFSNDATSLETQVRAHL